MLAAWPAPVVTVDRISVRKEETTWAPNGTLGLSPGSGGLVTSEGGCQVPDWTTAAARAMSRGLTSTLPYPMVSSASSAWLAGACMVPVKEGTGSCQDAPRPKLVAADCSSLAFSRSDRPANAVPHASAKSVRNVPRFGSGGLFVKFSPPTAFDTPQGIGVFSPRPELSSAAVETMVNAWPGWYLPVRADTAGLPAALCCATASTCPVAGSIATIAADSGSEFTARSAASCTFALIVVRTSVPPRPGQSFSTVITWPAAFSSTISVVDVPTSRRWNACCSPDSPTVVPGR